MKKLATILLCIFSISLNSQTTLFSENFETGGAGTFSLNTTDLSGTSTPNFWIVNNAYTGGSGSLICFGFPFTYTIANTPTQPAGITNNPSSYYLHTMSIYGQADNIFCSSFAAADGFCIFNDYPFSRMTNDISTVGYTNVDFSFWWVCAGGAPEIHGQVYYSTNAGSSWNQCTTPITQYANQITWTQTTINMAVFANQPTLRFGFRFYNTTASTAVDPGFSIDDVTIVGSVGGAQSITTGTINPTTICAGASINIPYTISGTFIAGNVFTAQLSDNLGSFASPVTLGTLNSVNAGTINGTIPGGTPPGSGYMIRVVSSTPAVTGTSSGPITISGPPIASASNTGPYCTRDTIFLSSSGGISYAWAGPSGFNSSSQNPIILLATVANAGIYTVTVTNAAGCTATATTNVVVNATPTPTASNTGPYCVGDNAQLSSSGGVAYAWEGPNSYTSAAQNPSISNVQLTHAGTYTVTVTSAQGCEDTAITTMVVTVCGNGIEESLLSQVSVYPNPTSDIFNITLDESMLGETHITILNMVGELVYSMAPNQAKTMISSKSLGFRAGIYLIKLKYRDQHKVIRLIVR